MQQKFFKDSDFKAFAGKTVKIIVVPNGAEQGRKFFDKMNEFATSPEVGAKGLAWTKIENNEAQGGIAKFITSEMIAKLENNFGVKDKSAIFFCG